MSPMTQSRAAVLGLGAALLAWTASADVARVELKDAKGKAPWDIRFESKDKLCTGVTGIVRHTSFFVPRDWAGKFVRFEVPFPMVNLDAVLFLNGRRIGDILRPAGELDVSRHLRYGATNEVALYCTFTGEGTDYGLCPIGHRNPRDVWMFSIKAPHFLVSEGPVISDVFANTSWRKKLLKMEVEVTTGEKAKAKGEGEGEAKAKGEGEQWWVDVSIADEDGKVVKHISSDVSRLTSLPCDNPLAKRYAIDIPWADPIPWELGSPYLYTAKVSLGQRSEVGGQRSEVKGQTKVVLNSSTNYQLPTTNSLSASARSGARGAS